MQIVNDRKEAEMTRTDLPQLRHPPSIFSAFSFAVLCQCDLYQNAAEDFGRFRQ